MFCRSSIIVALVSVLLLSGCGTSEAKTMNGTWKDGPFVAHIKPDHVDIYIVDDGSAWLYWTGNFQRRDKTFFSKANTKLLSNSIMGSEDKQKVFLLKGERLQFRFTILGKTTTVRLKHV